MSTQIEGFKLPFSSLDEAFKWLRKTQDTMVAKAVEMVEAHLAREATSRLDKVFLSTTYTHLGLPTPKNFPDKSATSSLISLAWNDFRDDIRACEKDRDRTPSYPILESTVFLFQDKTGVYGTHSFRDRDLQRLFLGMEGVEDYSYWNNTDPPDGIHRRQWTARGKHWDRLLGKGVFADYPSISGLQFTLVPSISLILPRALDAEIIEPHIPSFEKRVRSHTQDLAWAIYCKENEEEVNAAQKATGASAIMRLLRQVMDKDHPVALRAQQIVGSVLPRNVSAIDLCKEDCIPSIATLCDLNGLLSPPEALPGKPRM